MKTLDLTLSCIMLENGQTYFKNLVNTTKSEFTVNRGGKNIVFSDNFTIWKIETFVLFFLERKFDFGMASF